MTSNPANRTALRAQENRPAPPSQQVNANAVIGPTPYNRSVSSRAPRRCRAMATRSCRSPVSCVSVAASMSSATSVCR